MDQKRIDEYWVSWILVLKCSYQVDVHSSQLLLFRTVWLALEHGSGHLIVVSSGKCFNLTFREPLGHFSSVQLDQVHSVHWPCEFLFSYMSLKTTDLLREQGTYHFTLNLAML